MTKVTFYQNSDNRCIGFEVWDHAEFAEQGSDIVCAAISALVINTVNSIETFTEDAFILDTDEEQARIGFRLEGYPSKECTLLLNSLILGLQRIEDDEQNADFIDIIFREV